MKSITENKLISLFSRHYGNESMYLRLTKLIKMENRLNWALEQEDNRRAAVALKKHKEKLPKQKAHRINSTTIIILPADSTPEYIQERKQAYVNRQMNQSWKR